MSVSSSINEFGVDVTMKFENESQVSFGLYNDGYEMNHIEDYKEKWNEVQKNLIENIKDGYTEITYYNCNGSYTVAFFYNSNDVIIESSNFGAGMRFSTKVDREEWIVLAAKVLSTIK